MIYPNGAGHHGPGLLRVGGNTFHRIASGFPGTNDYIVQGGSLNGDGTGQVFATPYANEISPQLVFNGTGQLALANSGGTELQRLAVLHHDRLAPAPRRQLHDLRPARRRGRHPADMTKVTGTVGLARDHADQPDHDHLGHALDHQPQRRDPHRRHEATAGHADQRHGHGHRHGRPDARPRRPSRS